MTLWSVSNGYRGYGHVAALVEADTETDAIQQASAALKAENDDMPEHLKPDADYWHPDGLHAKSFTLPHVGDVLP